MLFDKQLAHFKADAGSRKSTIRIDDRIEAHEHVDGEAEAERHIEQIGGCHVQGLRRLHQAWMIIYYISLKEEVLVILLIKSRRQRLPRHNPNEESDQGGPRERENEIADCSGSGYFKGVLERLNQIVAEAHV